MLLSSVSEDSYWPPLGPPPSAWLHREGAAASKDAIYPTVKPPQRYSTDWFVSFVSSLFSVLVFHSTCLNPLNSLIHSMQLLTTVPTAVISRCQFPCSKLQFQPMLYEFGPRYCPTNSCSSCRVAPVLLVIMSHHKVTK